MKRTTVHCQLYALTMCNKRVVGELAVQICMHKIMIKYRIIVALQSKNIYLQVYSREAGRLVYVNYFIDEWK